MNDYQTVFRQVTNVNIHLTVCLQSVISKGITNIKRTQSIFGIGNIEEKNLDSSFNSCRIATLIVFVGTFPISVSLISLQSLGIAILIEVKS